MPNAHGGARAGAGRPRRSQRFTRQVADAEQRIADRLPLLIDAAMRLALGGFERVEEEFAPARTVTAGRGAGAMQAFPEAEPDALVLIKRKVSIAEPDIAALVYLQDRLMGRPNVAGDEPAEDETPGRRQSITIYLPDNGRDVAAA